MKSQGTRSGEYGGCGMTALFLSKTVLRGVNCDATADYSCATVQVSFITHLLSSTIKHCSKSEVSFDRRKFVNDALNKEKKDDEHNSLY